MIYGLKIRDKTIIEQMAAIRRKHVNFTTSIERNALFVEGKLQPTARSDVYSVEIIYYLQKRPIVNILHPALVVNFKGEKIPHVYPGEKLCLYQPKYNEFKYTDLLTDTIIPWTSLWLYHYENWHITGEWLGGGEHP